jgi:hypothetical protein
MKTGGLVLVAVLLSHPVSAADGPPLPEVMQQVATYVADFEQRLSRVIVEERYQQLVVPKKPRPCAKDDLYCASQIIIPAYVTLRSDLSLIKTGVEATWTQYRDVFEVNQLPVRHRDERLARLLAQPASREQLQAIVNESARFNVGSVVRNINTPLFALQILRADMQPRFRFRLAPRGRPAAASQPGGGAFRLAVEVWCVEFSERAKPTLVHDEKGKDVPASGRFWIEPDTGRVVMSELKFDKSGLRSSLTVSYQSEPMLGMLMPVQMREEYLQRKSGTVTTGTATYGQFRLLSDADVVPPNGGPK